MEKKPDFEKLAREKYLAGELGNVGIAFQNGCEHVWTALQSQLSELQEANQTLDKLMRSGEQRGHDKAEEHFKSQLSEAEKRIKELEHQVMLSDTAAETGQQLYEESQSQNERLLSALKGDKFAQGFLCAVVALITMNGEVDTRTRELFQSGGYKLQDLEKLGIDEHDVAVLMKHKEELTY